MVLETTKWVGLVLLLGYFWFHPPHVDFLWVGAYLAIVFGIGLSGFIVLLLLDKIFPRQKDINPFQLPPERGGGLHIPWRKLALVPGEDGAFYVPLLLLGVTVPHAAMFAFLFAVFHYPHYAVVDCIFKGGIFLVASVWILPHGLGSIVVGHIVQDVIVLGGLQLIAVTQQKQDAAHK